MGGEQTMYHPEDKGGSGHQGEPLHTDGDHIRLTGHRLVMSGFADMVNPVGSGARQ